MKTDKDIIKEFDKKFVRLLGSAKVPVADLFPAMYIEDFLLQTRKDDRENFIEILEGLVGKEKMNLLDEKGKWISRKNYGFNQATTKHNRKIGFEIKKLKEAKGR